MSFISTSLIDVSWKLYVCRRGWGKTLVVGWLGKAPYKIFYTNLKQAFEGGVLYFLFISVSKVLMRQHR